MKLILAMIYYFETEILCLVISRNFKKSKNFIYLINYMQLQGDPKVLCIA